MRQSRLSEWPIIVFFVLDMNEPDILDGSQEESEK